MFPLLRPAQVISRSAGNNLFPVLDKIDNSIFQGTYLWSSLYKSQVVDIKILLQCRMGKELIQNDLWNRTFFQFDHHTHSVPVRFIPQIRYTVDLAVPG